MSHFADSSAVVKLYLDEVGHELVRGLPDLVVTELARVEVPAAFWLKVRTGDLSREDASVLGEEFTADYYGAPGSAPRFVVLRTSQDVLDSAADLVAARGLRAYDAVQLASALALRAVERTRTRLCAFDRRLAAAAAAEGLEVVGG